MKDKREKIAAALTFIIASIILVAFAIPDRSDRRHVSPLNSCINNLRQIDGSTQQWAMENHKDTNAVPSWNDILPYMKSPPKCPRGGTYTLGPVGGTPACSIPEHQAEWCRMVSGK